MVACSKSNVKKFNDEKKKRKTSRDEKLANALKRNIKLRKK